jgi:ankyrin repeat protein
MVDDFFDKLDKQLEREELHFAAQAGKLSEVEVLLKKGRAVNVFDDLQKTPLHYAAEGEHIEVVKFLLSHGADVNAHNEKQIGNTALREVAATCSLEMAQILIDAGANPTIPGWAAMSALDLAKKRKNGDGPKVYALLLEAAQRFTKKI